VFLRMILARDFLFKVCNARRISVFSLSWFSLVVFGCFGLEGWPPCRWSICKKS
jgi:hypothetical protein